MAHFNVRSILALLNPLLVMLLDLDLFYHLPDTLSHLLDTLYHLPDTLSHLLDTLYRLQEIYHQHDTPYRLKTVYQHPNRFYHNLKTYSRLIIHRLKIAKYPLSTQYPPKKRIYYQLAPLHLRQYQSGETLQNARLMMVCFPIRF